MLITPPISREQGVKGDDGFLAFSRQIVDDPVFVILGCQGSGTNLLSQVLRSAFQFSVVQDRCLILRNALRVADHPSRRRILAQFQRIYNCLFPGPVRKRLLLNHYYHQARNYVGIEQYADCCGIRTADEFAHLFYAYHAYVTGSKYKAIKSDDIWEHLSSLHVIMPKRRYVFLVRDPRDNTLSIVNKPFGPCDVYCASEYVRSRMRAYHMEVARYPQQSLLVTYETLLSRPLDVVRQFSDHFAIAPVEDAAHRLRRLGIRSGNQEKWRSMPARSLAMCEAVLYDELIAFGYTPVNDRCLPTAWHERLRWRITDAAMRVPQKVHAVARNLVRP